MIRSRIGFWLGIAGIFGGGIGSSAWSQDAASLISVVGTPITGRLFADFYFPTSSLTDGSFQQISQSLWLKGDPKLSQDSSGHFTFRADHRAASAVSGITTFQTSLYEGYVDYVKNGWEFRVGQMILPWGKSDVINPTDFLTAKDYTFFNPDEEVRRLAAVSILLSWTPEKGSSPWTFTGVITPIFPRSQLLLAPGQIPSNVTVAASAATPPTTLANAETALKASYAGNHWDASLLAFRGWNHLPEYQVTGITGALPTVSVSSSQTFHRYKALGADASWSTGSWVLRGESAYVWTENDDGSNPLIQPTHLDAVLGVERPLWGDFRVQAQVIGRYFPRYTSPSQISDPNPAVAAVNQQVAQVNALIQNYQNQFRPAGTVRFSYSNDSSGWDAEAFVLSGFVGWDYLFKPKLSYAWTETLKTTLGVDYYGGPSDRPLGVLSPYNSVYTEAKLTF